MSTSDFDNREQLLRLYDVAVQEYRFQVQLVWDRTKFYLVFNSALFSAGAALIPIAEPPYLFAVAGILLIAAITAAVGLWALTVGHRDYYRRTVFKKTLIEDQLGLTNPLPEYDNPLATLSLGTTRTQKDSLKILHDTEHWLKRPIKFSSIVGGLRVVLLLLVLFNLTAFGCAVYMAMTAEVVDPLGAI